MRSIAVLVLIGLMAVQLRADPDVVYQSFQGNDFTDLDGWTAVRSFNPKTQITACKDIKMAGGFGVFAKGSSLVKQFRLPPHYKLQLKVQVWKIDSWDQERFYIYVDDKRVYDRSFAYNEGSQLCGTGGDWNEVRENVDLTIVHNSASATVVFTSTLDEDANNESWGVRDFQILVERCPTTCDTCSGSDATQCSFWKLNQWFFTETDTVVNKGWSLENARDGSYVCAGVPLMGGFNLYGGGAKIRNKLTLPPHYRVKVKFNFWKIDSWDGERASITIDGREVWGRNFNLPDVYQNTICGAGNAGWNTASVTIDADLSHNAPTADVLITSTLDQAANDESWGVRDFFVFVAPCAENCDSCSGPAAADCTKCASNFAFTNGQCQALTNFVLLESSFWDQGFSDAKDWQLAGAASSPPFTQCGDQTLVGGFKVFGSKAAASKKFNLPPHKRLRIQVQLWKIDSWDDETIFVNVDGGRVFEQKLGFANGGAQICGRQESNWNELIMNVDTVIVHGGDSATVQISSTLDQDASDESWGFRNFKIFYEAKPACAILYTECSFKGATFELCQDSPNFKSDSIPPQIRSLKVPPQGKVTLYQQTQYGGQSVTYDADQECIQTFNFPPSFEQMSAAIHLKENDEPVLTYLRKSRQ